MFQNSYGFDAMADPHDVLALLAHLVHKLHRTPALVHGFRELTSCSIESSSKSVSLEKFAFYGANGQMIETIRRLVVLNAW